MALTSHTLLELVTRNEDEQLIKSTAETVF